MPDGRCASMQDFEKLGVFYLGKEYDLAKDKLLDRLVMFDARDLTTHAVCVGMTGSGKTDNVYKMISTIDEINAVSQDKIEYNLISLVK